MLRRTWIRAAVLLIACMLASSAAFAQITTGTVTGNVRDEQGGVIPGATVVLISEARGTKSAPAVTNETGNFVFPNVTPDTYTVEVTMDSFKTVRRTGIASAAATASACRRSRSKPGTIAETVNVIAEAVLVQSRRAASARSPSPASKSRTCRSSHGNFTNVTALTPGRGHRRARRPAARVSAAPARTTS